MLSVLPCSDKEECTTTAKTEQSIISSNSNHDQHNHENEQCTPFCVCACCGVHGFQLQMPFFNFKEKKVFTDKEKQKNSYTFIYSNEFTSNIWQPPKLS
jgi:hypothetical protein